MDNLMRTIQTAIQSDDYATLSAIFSSDYGSLTWQNVGQGEQRSLAAELIHWSVSNPNGFVDRAVASSADMMHVFITALGHLPTSGVPNAADNTLRQKLFEAKIADEDYSGAARILAGLRMEEEDEKSPYFITPVEKADVYVKIAECFLAQDEIAESDAAVNKAGTAVEAIPNKEQHMALLLRYKSTTARVLDANRKFLQAATRYHELSQTTATELIDADDLLQMLGRAATCAILAPSGPQRHRVLGHLARDVRLSQLDRLPEFCTQATIVRKMYKHQLLQPAELTQLEASLLPHQKAIMGDGLTILQRGVVEHNMIAVSHIYQSIYITELAHILNVTPRRAEKIAADMILDGSLLNGGGVMDQVEGLLIFQSDEPPGAQWDRALTTFCAELNRVTDSIKTATVATN